MGVAIGIGVGVAFGARPASTALPPLTSAGFTLLRGLSASVQFYASTVVDVGNVEITAKDNAFIAMYEDTTGANRTYSVQTINGVVVVGGIGFTTFDTRGAEFRVLDLANGLFVQFRANAGADRNYDGLNADVVRELAITATIDGDTSGTVYALAPLVLTILTDRDGVDFFSASPAWLDRGATIPNEPDNLSHQATYAYTSDLLVLDHIARENAGKLANLNPTVSAGLVTAFTPTIWNAITTALTERAKSWDEHWHGTALWHQSQANSVREAARLSLDGTPAPKALQDSLLARLGDATFANSTAVDINEVFDTIWEHAHLYDNVRGPVLTLDTATAADAFGTTLTAANVPSLPETATASRWRPGRSALKHNPGSGQTWYEVTANANNETKPNGQAGVPYGYDNQADNGGSIWYDLFARAFAGDAAYWPHGVMYHFLYPLHMWQAAGQRTSLQDFNIEAGRGWGTTNNIDPAGYTNAVAEFETRRTDEIAKRRALIDSLNYAAVWWHPTTARFLPDWVGFQFHIAPSRMIDERDLGEALHYITALGVDTAVTELDTEADARSLLADPSTGVDGTDFVNAGPETTTKKTIPAGVMAYAAAYTRRLVHLMARHSRLFLVRGWGDFSIVGQKERIQYMDFNGSTGVGRAGYIEAFDAARFGFDLLAPADRVVGVAGAGQRSIGPVARPYHLCFGLTRHIWRATQDTSQRAFDVAGNGSGTRLFAGLTQNGITVPAALGARLSLVKQAEGLPPPPAWRVDGATVQVIDPAYFGGRFQWQHNTDTGPILRLMAGATEQFRIGVNAGQISISTDGGSTWAAAFIAAPSTGGNVALAWQRAGGDYRITVRTAVASQTRTVTMSGGATALDLFGDGVGSCPNHRAQHLVIYRDPPDNATLDALALPIGGHTPSASEIMADTNFLTFPYVALGVGGQAI